MAAALDLHPDAAHPVLSGVAEIEESLDRILGGVVEPLSPGDYAAAVRSLERISRRVAAVQLKLVAAADVAEAAKAAGFTSTGAWVARHTQASRSQAARDVVLAGELGSGHGATADALGAGLLSAAHAAVIVDAGRQLPDGVSDQQRRQVETDLVAKAQRFAPDQLRRVARRAIEVIEPEQAAVDAHENELIRAEEEVAREQCSLTFHDNDDGTITGHFTVPVLAAGILRKVIDSMTAPRRMREPGRSDHRPPLVAGTRMSGRSFDWRQRRGLAFAELLEHLPTDHLHSKTAATVVVTIGHSVLQEASKAGHLDTGEKLSAGEARRLACGAGLIPAVLGTGSVALDLGRETRLFTEAQRLAIGLAHDTCAADGCTRPFAWCELHHRQPWSHGGRTDLADAVPLCHWHHQRIHDDGFGHRRLPDGNLRFSRRA